MKMYACVAIVYMYVCVFGVHHVTQNGRTPLAWAAAQSNYAAIVLLLLEGAVDLYKTDKVCIECGVFVCSYLRRC